MSGVLTLFIIQTYSLVQVPPLYADVLFREQKNSILYSECTLKNPYRCHRHYRHRSATGERAADEKTRRQPLAYRIARRLEKKKRGSD